MSEYTYKAQDLGGEYGFLLNAMMNGEESSPRGQLIREYRPLTVILEDPRRCVVKRPGMSRAFMFMEQLQLLAGEFDQEMLMRYSVRGASMLNHYGSYGPRIRDQLPEVVRELVKDPDSRRAVAYVCRPSDLMYATELNMPCTMGYQFFIRNGRLECVTTMRSWDVVWGLSYDIPNAAQLQMCVAEAVCVPLGPLTFVAGSGHIYEKHFDLVPGRTDYRLPSMASSIGEGVGIRRTMADARSAFLAERAWPGGSAPRSIVPQQWEEAFDTFKRAAEKKNADNPSS